jgi:hypothetical protein
VPTRRDFLKALGVTTVLAGAPARALAQTWEVEEAARLLELSGIVLGTDRVHQMRVEDHLLQAEFRRRQQDQALLRLGFTPHAPIQWHTQLGAAIILPDPRTFYWQVYGPGASQMHGYVKVAGPALPDPVWLEIAGARGTLATALRKAGIR